MKNPIFIVVLLVSLTFSCADKKDNKKYPNQIIDEAWEKGDKQYFFNYLDSIERLGMVDFIKGLAQIGNRSNFLYGLMDHEADWNKISTDTITYCKENAVRVHKIFYEYCDYKINNSSYDSLDYMQNKYFNRCLLSEYDYDNVTNEIRAYFDQN